MKTFMLILLVSSQVAFACSTTEDSRPNILYIYVDDMGWGSIGPNGQAERKAKGLPYVRTPNINRLAAEGVNFRRGYACPVCSPSRASQQTGFHQGHTFADRNDPDNARKAMRSDDVTMGDVLSAAGYQTGYWGKWGFGGSKDRDDPTIDNLQTLPTSHGYKHVLAELHHVRAHTFFQPTLWHAPAAIDQPGGLELIPNSMANYLQKSEYPNTPALQNHIDYPEIGYCDDAYAFAALDFVRHQSQNRNATGQPFFGLLAVQVPHGPFADIATLPDWDKAYADDPHFAALANQTQQWAAMVTRIDTHIGNILAALEDPNNDGDTSDSVADNTLVIFQSDNGGPAGKNNQQLDANGGLRGVKGTVYEGGIRVPLVMRWPSKINDKSAMPAGSETRRVVDITDLLPTFCDLANVPTPVGIDGVSIAPALLGNKGQRTREFLIHETARSQSIIRGRYKLVRSRNGSELFDLETDAAESNNLAREYPDLVEQLTTLLIGERVTEPKGFANTYHRWTGTDGGKTSDANNWSNYQYSNAGEVYLTDDGAPQLSWTAKITNNGHSSADATADADLELLSLEIAGSTSGSGVQTLTLASGITLTGRNEIRISAGGVLDIGEGEVSSQRWVDVLPGGELRGYGVVKATVYNAGTLTSDASPDNRLQIDSDYHQLAGGILRVGYESADVSPISIAGTAELAGQLQLGLVDNFKLKKGQRLTVLQANDLVGRFENANSELLTSDGVRMEIKYEANKVLLVAK